MREMYVLAKNMVLSDDYHQSPINQTFNMKLEILTATINKKQQKISLLSCSHAALSKISSTNGSSHRTGS